MNTTQIIALLRRTWLLVLACFVVGASAGTIAAFTTPPRYEATSRVYVSAQGVSSANELANGAVFVRQAIASYREIALTGLVLDPVIDELGLDTTAAELAATLRVSTVTTTQVLSITATEERPALAAQIANAVGESLTTVIMTELERPPGADVSGTVRVTTVSPARVPIEPSAPNIPLLIVIGSLLGLALGLGLAILRALLDTRVHATADAERATGAPVIGGVLHDPDLAIHPLVVRDEPRGPQAEAFRRMRTNTRFLGIDGGTPAIVITSAGTVVGKSTTCVNLALAFAETGARVALVDADLRRPSLGEMLAVDPGPGLSDVLAAQAPLTAALQRWGEQKLFVVPAGTAPPNPSELLGSPAMADVVDALRASFDIVLIDSPPVLAATDAALVSSVATGAVLVAASGSTRASQLQAAVRALATADAALLGVVLTMLPTRGPDSASYAQYTHGALHPPDQTNAV